MLMLTVFACGKKDPKLVILEGELIGLGNDTLHLYGDDKLYPNIDTIPATEGKFKARLHADTLVSGRTNCNRFFGPYQLNGKSLKFGMLGMTRMACPEMQYEDLFVRMLDRVNGFEIKGSDLKLLDGEQVLAEFRGTAAAAK